METSLRVFIYLVFQIISRYSVGIIKNGPLYVVKYTLVSAKIMVMLSDVMVPLSQRV